MRRYLLSTLLVLTTSVACAQEFCIKAKLAGMEKGTSVSILRSEKPLDHDNAKSNAQADAMKSGDMSAYTHEDTELAHAIIGDDGIIELRGHVDHPQVVTLITNNLGVIEERNKNKSGDERYKGLRWTYTRMFLSNCEYSISATEYMQLTDAPISDVCVISGGQEQADFNEYNLMLQQYSEEGFNNRERATWQFIETHPTSVVSVYLASNMLDNGYNLKADQIKHLKECITDCPADPLRYEYLCKKIKLAEQTAVGNDVIDLSLVSDKGNEVQLADALPHGKYVLVDFWASWCGICRAGTPRIKELYGQYSRNDFDVISVSCDKSDSRWRDAMEKDEMPWAQYLMTEEGYKDFFAKYQTTGVPYLLLVDRDGKVLGNPGSPEAVARMLEKLIPAK